MLYCYCYNKLRVIGVTLCYSVLAINPFNSNNTILRCVVSADESLTVAEVKSPETNTLVIGAGRDNCSVGGHVETRDRQTVTIEIEKELEHINKHRYCLRTRGHK